MPPALVGRGIKHVRVTRVESDVGHARVLADGQHGLPRLAAIGGLVQTTFAPGVPERSLRGHIDDLGVPGIDEHLGDMLGTLQPNPGEAGAAVDRLVESVAVPHAALAVVLTGPHPDDQMVRRIDRHAADRVRPVAVKDRRPRRARVRRSPDAARRRDDVPGAALSRIDGDVADPSRHQCRADSPQGHAPENVLLALGTRPRPRALLDSWAPARSAVPIAAASKPVNPAIIAPRIRRRINIISPMRPVSRVGSQHRGPQKNRADLKLEEASIGHIGNLGKKTHRFGSSRRRVHSRLR